MNASNAISLEGKWRVVLSLAATVLLSGLSLRVDGATTAYTYDALNRLTQVTNSDGSVITYTYDAAGNRLIQTFTAGTQQTAPTITSGTTATFAIGQAGSFTVTATGTPAPTFSATGLPAWASLNMTTGILNGTPPNSITPGTIFTINLTAANGTLPNASQVFTLNVQPPLTFTQWEGQPGFFTPSQLANPSISGPTATPQNDGIPNLLKNLYNLNPAIPMTAADRDELPTVGMTTIGGTDYLTLTYRQYALLDQSTITINVQTSPDLKTWTTVNPPDLSQQIGTDSTTGDPIMEVGVKTNGTNKQFIRLNVTQP